jgi:hypothetical protein
MLGQFKEAFAIAAGMMLVLVLVGGIVGLVILAAMTMLAELAR